jgi:hypothetical protein
LVGVWLSLEVWWEDASLGVAAEPFFPAAERLVFERGLGFGAPPPSLWPVSPVLGATGAWLLKGARLAELTTLCWTLP